MKKYYKINWKNSISILTISCFVGNLFKYFILLKLEFRYGLSLVIVTMILIMSYLTLKYDLSLYDSYFKGMLSTKGGGFFQLWVFKK